MLSVHIPQLHQHITQFLQIIPPLTRTYYLNLRQIILLLPRIIPNFPENILLLPLATLRLRHNIPLSPIRLLSNVPRLFSLLPKIAT